MNSDRPPPAGFEDYVIGVIVVCAIGTIVWLACIALESWLGKDAHAADEVPSCSSAIPQPPLVVVLPDGTEIPATRIDYELASRRIVVIGNPRLFCSGYES